MSQKSLKNFLGKISPTSLVNCLKAATTWAKLPQLFCWLLWTSCLVLHRQQHVLFHLFLKWVHWTDKSWRGRRRREEATGRNAALDLVNRPVLVPCFKCLQKQLGKYSYFNIRLFTRCLHAGHWERPFCRCCSECPGCLRGAVWGNTELIWTAAAGKKDHRLGHTHKKKKIRLCDYNSTNALNEGGR